MSSTLFLSALLAASAEPEIDPNTWYSPGAVGFIATFLVVAGAILIILDMVRRVRRVRYWAEIQERLAAEAQDQEPGDTAAKPKPARPAPPTKPKRPEPPAKPER